MTIRSVVWKVNRLPPCKAYSVWVGRSSGFLSETSHRMTRLWIWLKKSVSVGNEAFQVQETICEFELKISFLVYQGHREHLSVWFELLRQFKWDWLTWKLTWKMLAEDILDLDLDFSDREFANLPNHHASQCKGLQRRPCSRKTKKVGRTGNYFHYRPLPSVSTFFQLAPLCRRTALYKSDQQQQQTRCVLNWC